MTLKLPPNVNWSGAMSRTRHHGRVQKERQSQRETWGGHGIKGWSGGVRRRTCCISVDGYGQWCRRLERRFLGRLFRREMEQGDG